ncbi:hypothetical protein HHI36_008564 [Cryptolaemus montrouzieri]|uniref:Transcription factor cwo n=1 Tax=Cryptolaemus montrouzieri TaxID=559131 RepID=A0ABD2MT14_9CUCU
MEKETPTKYLHECSPKLKIPLPLHKRGKQSAAVLTSAENISVRKGGKGVYQQRGPDLLKIESYECTECYEDYNTTKSTDVECNMCNLNDDPSQHKHDRSIFPCCDSNFNFSTATCSEDDSEFGTYKKSKSTRQDPMSHRIIEKRRRDRMNNCLADLSRLIPTEYLKKGRGRIEKTEIIEMAIKHMKYLQQDSNPSEQYRLGYQECMSEAMRFMVEVEGHFSHEAVCVRLLTHLQKHCASLSSRPTPVPQTVPIVERHAETPSNDRNTVQVPEYEESMKVEIEQNNNNEHKDNNSTSSSHLDETENGHLESNRISYKYKTNIKLRFNQDLNGGTEPKRAKLESGRRNSVTSIENRSSSHSSPPNSETCTRISDVEHISRTSPSDSTLSSNHQLKIELASSNETNNPCSPREPSLHSLNVKNFKVPIFMLHTKGSYYVPLTVDYKSLSPYMHNYDILDEIPSVHSVVLHPVTINVNFQPGFSNQLESSKYKCDYSGPGWH